LNSRNTAASEEPNPPAFRDLGLVFSRLWG
jgi:hypothetical protein